jgi:hypothetical protein
MGAESYHYRYLKVIEGDDPNPRNHSMTNVNWHIAFS